MDEPPAKRPVDEGESSDDDIPSYLQLVPAKKQKSASSDSYYLDTINRQVLDFDFEKVCLVTLSNVNPYCCLVCGKYFQGKSKSSPAYLHSLATDHHVFINLGNESVHILPENYEVVSPSALESLRDITNVLAPKYPEGYVIPSQAHDLNRNEYRVGYIGLNNILNNDYSNVVLQAVAHVPLIRDFYLSLSHKKATRDSIARKSLLNTSFGLLVQKLWSSHLFKGHISPHEFLQIISGESKNAFSTRRQESPKKFLVWLLNQLHSQLSRSIKSSKTPWSKSFQGSLEITTTGLSTRDSNNKVEFVEQNSNTISTKYWVLTLDLPTNPVFSQEGNFAEVALEDLLEKYNGTKSSGSSNSVKTYQLLQPMPPHLILHIDRGIEDGNKRGNQTVVKLPEVLDVSRFVKGAEEPINYRLMSSVKYELEPGTEIGREDDRLSWSVGLRRGGEWINIHDLEVTESQTELLFLDQNYIQIWEKV
ncbi:ubiquitin specific protease [Suhomyces tanzawaensis NRRL Y-17324]|uniref:Ubiquitin specific protease n=1 Tax=Suhomyces tanzawaensis NRRL Y-17324 TaxID=984487 RepID=A0A1E4SCE7_9ASCO|nr:ubiquitin specific protease [Suhomyces tanzawaensis NRRL Y-17324]ODV77165.1 ubiquitin specific protease [Suhomyces tanzawaensis NRRL Y-17324]